MEEGLLTQLLEMMGVEMAFKSPSPDLSLSVSTLIMAKFELLVFFLEPGVGSEIPGKTPLYTVPLGQINGC